MHLLSIEGADWPKLHDMFKACDAKAWQREFLVGFPVSLCLEFVIYQHFSRCCCSIESRCMIKQNMSCWYVSLFHFYWKNWTCVEVRMWFFQQKINKLTDQQDMFYYKINSLPVNAKHVVVRKNMTRHYLNQLWLGILTLPNQMSLSSCGFRSYGSVCEMFLRCKNGEAGQDQ